MRLVFPHVQRMRSLQVNQVPLKIRRLIFDKLDGARLPSLETLEVDRGFASNERLTSADRTFKPFKNGDAIDLKTVLLKRTPYDYTIRRFKNLKHLAIVSSNIFGNSSHDNAKTVQNILSLLPHLQTLRIHMEYSPNPRPTDIRPSSHPPPLTHSSPEELSLDATYDDIDTVVCALVLPSLHRLSCQAGGVLPIGIYCLPTLAQARPSYPLPNLRILRIVGPRRAPNLQTQNDTFWRNIEPLEQALAGLPKLRSLCLEYVDLKDGKYLACLARTCPRLERLTILRCRGLTFWELRAVVQSRRDPKGLGSDSLEYVGVEDDPLSIQMLQEKAKQDGLGEDAEFNIEISKARRYRIVVFERSRHCVGGV
ncbi:hypothetical protein FRC04_004830 [Tulasnella sp. 424]|nr:hypothetical protein FRC04_004830 [Tulasnella sp. 424]KAG8963742.1 hypothetical protein FRC05_004535 [Tulasnella sp. 425]